MDNEEIQGAKFSEFPSATPGNSDDVVGLHSGDNARFSIANIIAAIRQGLVNIFVPLTRTVNNKALSSDITLDASDVGAVDTADVGVADGVASLDSNGKVPGTQLDLSGKQDTITASGILKGDGQGGVSAATAGTDYQAPLTAGTDYATPAQLADKANQSQLAYVETGTTASRAYAVGEYFCWNGLLYRAKTAISSGGTFTPGTNCESVTGGIASQLLAAGNARYTQYYKTDSNGTVTHNVSAGCMFLIMTYNVNSAERTNGVYFGWVDTANANNSHVNTIFTPTAYPPTVTVGLGTISIEVLRYTRITILEFVRTN